MLKDNIFIFFHIATIGNYQEIVDEIFTELVNSNLIKIAEKINLCIVGMGNVSIPNHKNLNIYQSDNISFGEFYTLNKIKEFSDNTTNNYKILYIHTKGVTNPNNVCVIDWRKYMIYFNINKHSNIVSLLENYDTCGVDLVSEPTKHYSGNFWWANSFFIKKLPNIDEISKPSSKAILTVRHNSEFWLFMREGKNISIHNSNINVYERHLHRYKKENYINENI